MGGMDGEEWTTMNDKKKHYQWDNVFHSKDIDHIDIDHIDHIESRERVNRQSDQVKMKGFFHHGD